MSQAELKQLKKEGPAEKKGRGHAKAGKDVTRPSSILVHIGVGVLCFGLGSWSPWTSGVPVSPAVVTPQEEARPEQRSKVPTGAAYSGDPWAFTTHPDMGRDGFNWTQLSMSRAGNFPPGGIKHLTAEMVRTRGQMWVHHTVFARSIPALVLSLIHI